MVAKPTTLDWIDCMIRMGCHCCETLESAIEQAALGNARDAEIRRIHARQFLANMSDSLDEVWALQRKKGLKVPVVVNCPEMFITVVQEGRERAS